MFINFQLSRHECISLSVSLSILVAIEYSVYLSSISAQEVCRNVLRNIICPARTGPTEGMLGIYVARVLLSRILGRQIAFYADGQII